MTPRYGRVTLRPLEEFSDSDWRRLQSHFRDPEIAHLNGTPPNRMPLWLLRRLLKTDSNRPDRATFGIFDEHGAYIGTTELYDVTDREGTLGIIIGERTHWSAGYGPEAMNALLGYAYGHLGLRLVRLETFGDNLRAQRAFRKVGFTEVSRHENAKGRVDVRMTLTRERWLARSNEPATGHEDWPPAR